MTGRGAVDCELCREDGGELVLRTPAWRLVHVRDAAYPGFFRVIWNDHVAEFTDLQPAQRSQCMQAVAKVEQVLRETLRPDKINLAALGNMVPHLHWHVVARFAWDPHFPQPIWAAAQRAPDLAAIEALQPALTSALQRLSHLSE